MRKKVLVVDDVAINRDILSEILCDRFEVLEAADGAAALSLVREHADEIAAMLLDLMMPVLDGFAVLDAMRSMDCAEKIPILVISGETSVESERRCLEQGVADFIHKPFEEALVLHRVFNAVALYEYKNSLEDQVAEKTAELVERNLELEEQTKRLERYNNTIVDVLGTVVESRNLESGEHIQRVKGYTRIMAEAMMEKYPEYGLTPAKINVITSAAALHDVGKIAIPDAILLKPGRLTPEEFSEMKLHTTRGCEILDKIENAWDEEYKKESYVICRYHHERFDGRGYPDGLREDEIPVSAQLVSVADVYDALTTKRVYKDAYGKDTAYRMILNGECGTFSPKLMDCLSAVKDRMEAMVNAE